MATDLLERPDAAAANEDNQVLVTLTVGEQLCGVPVLAVRDILGEQTITRIPLAPPEIAGSLNLRGRIVTAIDLRRRLRLPPLRLARPACRWSPNKAANSTPCSSIRSSEVLSLDASMFERNPPTLEKCWADFSTGIFRLDGRLLVVLDVARLLALSGEG